MRTLDFHFLSVHAFVGPFENIVDAVAFFVFGHAVGDGVSFPGVTRFVFASLLEFRFHSFQKLVSVIIVVVLQQHDKFVATDSVNGGLLVDVAEYVAGTEDVLVAAVVSVMVVHVLEVVDIDHHEGERGCSLVNLLLQRFLHLVVGGLAVDVGQGVRKSEVRHVFGLFLGGTGEGLGF